MAGLGEVLACRLAAEDERSRRQRQMFEEQRQWLLSQIMSLPREAGRQQPKQPQQEQRRRQQSQQPKPSSHDAREARRGAGVCVEERLLEYGRQKADRLEKARMAREEEKEMAERVSLRAAEIKPQRCTRAPMPISAEELSRKRAERHGRLVEESAAELSFQPRISVESARLAKERKAKEHIEGMPVVESLLYRKAVADERMQRKRAESNVRRASPMITAKAKQMALPFTAAERLYLHAKERHIEEKDMEERLHDAIEDNLECVFHPSISEMAEKLQRKPGRHAYEDLYEYGVLQQQQRRHAASQEGVDFHPSIDRVSEIIATRMNESTTDRLLKPRETKRAATPPPKVQLRREDLDQRFTQLYMESGVRAARRRSLSIGQQEAGPECTFAPRINRSRVSNGSLAELPLDVRMRLWQERRNQKLKAARREAEEKEEEEAACPGAAAVATAPVTPSSRVAASLMERADTCRPQELIGDCAALGIEPHMHSNSDVAPTPVRSIEHRNTLLHALQALEDAERVSQYIMVD
ncbi:hypothetical protein DQ04_05651010 [Trypanosoma grayi]|uniref:hypothetical protein n=1 Tax=Trypanosoma grayi TaxID=71804 RepID=UPI0004F45C93|nr:hypothetical protein DQ04_05651010 [Trypanosoma grayi]KEG09185.1 hypothetical protein DQ04_05651010 [Trypanosoma grayi]